MYVRSKDVESVQFRAGVSVGVRVLQQVRFVRWIGAQVFYGVVFYGVVFDGGTKTIKASGLPSAVASSKITRARSARCHRKDEAVPSISPCREPLQNRLSDP